MATSASGGRPRHASSLTLAATTFNVDFLIAQLKVATFNSDNRPLRSSASFLRRAGAGLSMSPIPESIISVDVETTGLSSEDRVVTLGAWRIKTSDLLNGSIDHAEHLYLIFNPNRKCHPRAAAVHGYSDWTLRHQQYFVELAPVIREFLDGGEVVVAHNASLTLASSIASFSTLTAIDFNASPSAPCKVTAGQGCKEERL
jgi:hypothetical protein